MSQQKERTEELYKLAVEYSKFYGGKIMMVPKVPVRTLDDFSIWYTPGVAAVSRAIAKDPNLSFELTSRWNTIAIVTDGTRVLGLGNVGPEAAMPVMEGKALIFKYLGGVNAVPITIGVRDQQEFFNIVKALEPAFGGFNLEDIESPKCFFLLDNLRKTLKVPVWHDDQQGTAGATLAGLFNALKLTDRKPKDTRVVFFGAGASNIATARVLITAGFDPGNLILIDTKGILHPEREDMDELMLHNPWKYEFAIKTNKDRIKGGLKEALKGADVLVAASKPGPGTFPKEYIKEMNKDPIVFVLANPVPEIWPWEAKEMGAKIVATGRSDFPNQVNNSLVFPAVFRGALDAKAVTITDEMIVAASAELAKFAEEKGISENYIIPTMEEWEVYPRVAATVAQKAVEQGLARNKMSWQEFHERARQIIEESRLVLSTLVKNGLIQMPPKVEKII
jgi:malate dehydrogenase (oxaloacetate-decarboxylating)